MRKHIYKYWCRNNIGLGYYNAVKLVKRKYVIDEYYILQT